MSEGIFIRSYCDIRSVKTSMQKIECWLERHRIKWVSVMKIPNGTDRNQGKRFDS